MSFPLFGKLAYCKSMQAAVGSGPASSGGGPRSVRVTHASPSESLSSIVCQRIVGDGEIVFSARYFAHVAKLASELLSVVSWNVLERTVCVDPVLQEHGGH